MLNLFELFIDLNIFIQEHFRNSGRVVFKELWGSEAAGALLDSALSSVIESEVIHTEFRPISTFYPYWAKNNVIPIFYEVVIRK